MSDLVLRGLTKSYGTVAALDGIDLEVASGSRAAIVGPSGCGKSTLLRLIAGFEPPDAGSVALGGETLADDRAVVPPHRRRIGIVMQDGALFPHLSVSDNVAFGLARGAPDREAAVIRLLDLVELPRAKIHHRPDQLSGGQQQRVALARALAREPMLMLLDEPFSALDAGLRAATRDAVADLLSARGITTMLVTHDQDEALGFADQVAVMVEGRFRRVGTPREVYLRPNDAEVASFLGEAILFDVMMQDGRALCPLGALPVDTPDRTGLVRVMLRPEQVRIGPVGTGVGGCVVAARFRGPVTALIVSLDGGAPGAAPLRLTVAGSEAPTAGEAVGLTVVGTGHVLGK